MWWRVTRYGATGELAILNEADRYLETALHDRETFFMAKIFRAPSTNSLRHEKSIHVNEGDGGLVET